MAKMNVTVEDGMVTLKDGTQVDLLKIQATLNNAFQETGEQEYAAAADKLSLITQKYQGPHGDFFDLSDAEEGDAQAPDSGRAVPNENASETSVKVKHWEAYGQNGTVETHQFDIDDRRLRTGQAFATVGALEGDLDDMLSVMMEVGTNPLNGVDHVPSAHVHFDGDNLAISLFKIGDKILMRPESQVSFEAINPIIHGFAEPMFWIETARD